VVITLAVYNRPHEPFESPIARQKHVALAISYSSTHLTHLFDPRRTSAFASACTFPASAFLRRLSTPALQLIRYSLELGFIISQHAKKIKRCYGLNSPVFQKIHSSQTVHIYRPPNYVYFHAF
jgi:hypothetical protein